MIQQSGQLKSFPKRRKQGCIEFGLARAGGGGREVVPILPGGQSNPAGLASESEIGAEWPLDKVSIFAGSTFPAAVAVGDFNEATARLIE